MEAEGTTSAPENETTSATAATSTSGETTSMPGETTSVPQGDTSAGESTDSGEVSPDIGFRKIVLSTEYFSEGVAIGDFDGDGLRDIASGPQWYAGPDFVDAHSIYAAVAFDPTWYADAFSLFAADFSADGLDDLLVVGFPGFEAVWYENPGRDGDPWVRQLAMEGVDGESPAFADVTGDGRPELVCMHGGQLGYAEPDWTDTTQIWTFRPISTDLGFMAFTHGLGVGDLNGDGRLDLLEATGWWEQPADLTMGVAWGRHEQSFGLGGAQMFATDVDADGDADVLTTYEAHGFGVSWFEQDANTFREHAIAPQSADENGPTIFEPHALAQGDIDGDGVVDIVTGERFWGHLPPGEPSFNDPAKLYWFELAQAGPDTRWIPHLIDEASGVGTQIALADLDADERLDIVTVNKKGAFVFLQNGR